jgi:hypothetical protein
MTLDRTPDTQKHDDADNRIFFAGSSSLLLSVSANNRAHAAILGANSQMHLPAVPGPNVYSYRYPVRICSEDAAV